MKWFLIFIITIVVVLGLLKINLDDLSNKNINYLRIKDVVLNIEVVNTDKARIKGLSGREKLANKAGMLFIFEKEGYHGIWMKDMKFPIDIAWLNKDKKIIHIEKNVGPETYPKVFHALKDGVQILSLYVLETNANLFEKYKIEIGDQAQF